MTKIERALAELSELYEFYASIQERTWRRTSTQPNSGSHSLSREVENAARSPGGSLNSPAVIHGTPAK